MTYKGWLFLSASWGMVVTIVAYCFYRLFGSA